jgi:hypothetical protein
MKASDTRLKARVPFEKEMNAGAFNSTRCLSRGSTPMKLATIALALSASPVLATVVSTEAIEQLTQKAPLIVRGTVKSTSSLWANPRTIVTRTQLQVDEVLKGSAPASITLQQPGGTVDGITAQVSGTAQFAVQESVVLFLEPLPRTAESTAPVDTYIVLSLTAGKVSFAAPNPASNSQQAKTSAPRLATRNLQGLSVYGAKGPVQAADNVESLGESSAFLTRLKKLIKGAK